MIEMMVIVAFIMFITWLLMCYVYIKYNLPVEMYRTVNQFHKWLEISLFVMFIASVTVLMLTSLYTFLEPVIIAFLTIGFGVRAYMEYKHGIEEKSHLPDLVAAVGSSVTLIVVIMFLI
ncbi:DUF4181 domain-containing protein [Alkalibacillus haloalkaliphilus]|uniref:DUF4181 domain-containing protein n=1 Tax=Alkalibacillus haloalkaliphilus TaxID=94136 RepID=UPI00036CE02A|nr:DUF4181 domain-containing protein [Alkalibacillus haloalkaliphilus]